MFVSLSVVRTVSSSENRQQPLDIFDLAELAWLLNHPSSSITITFLKSTLSPWKSTVVAIVIDASGATMKRGGLDPTEPIALHRYVNYGRSRKLADAAQCTLKKIQTLQIATLDNASVSAKKAPHPFYGG